MADNNYNKSVKDLLPNESVAKLEKLVDEFDKDIKIIDFYVNIETFYDLRNSANNIKYMTNLLADCSRHLASIHSIRYEFTSEYQIVIYDRVDKLILIFRLKKDLMSLKKEEKKFIFFRKN
jgi:hypothetical protein